MMDARNQRPTSTLSVSLLLGLAATASLGLLGGNLPATAEATASRPSLADGTYLYGQAPQPGLLGREYLVLQVEGDRAVGAVYYPRSEFNCFSGRVGPRQLSLQIADDYTNELYPYAIALVPASPLASSGESLVPFDLQGYKRLEAPSPTDLHLLATCRQRAATARIGQ